MTTKADIEARMKRRREAVIDLLAQHPEGMTIADIAGAMGVPVQAVTDDIRRLRREPEVPNIPCQPNGFMQPWLYFLTNEVKPNEKWAQGRVEDQHSRFRTEVGMAATLVTVTSPRSLEGRKARKIARVLEFLMLELGELEAEMNGVLTTR